MPEAFKDATPRPWRWEPDEITGEARLYREVKGRCSDFIGNCKHIDGPLLIAAVNSYDPDREAKVRALVEAAKNAEKWLQSMNEAEGMLDGFGPRRPRSSDEDLNVLRAALKDME